MSIRVNIFDNLANALQGIVGSPSYELPIAAVSRFPVNAATLDKHKFPHIVILDSGEESLTVRDGTHYQFLVVVPLICYVRSDTGADLSEDLNKLISDIKKFINSEPSLGANLLKLRLVGLEDNVWQTDAGFIGYAVIMTTIRYWCLAGTF